MWVRGRYARDGKGRDSLQWGYPQRQVVHGNRVRWAVPWEGRGAKGYEPPEFTSGEVRAASRDPTAVLAVPLAAVHNGAVDVDEAASFAVLDAAGGEGDPASPADGSFGGSGKPDGGGGGGARRPKGEMTRRLARSPMRRASLWSRRGREGEVGSEPSGGGRSARSNRSSPSPGRRKQLALQRSAKSFDADDNFLTQTGMGFGDYEEEEPTALEVRPTPNLNHPPTPP